MAQIDSEWPILPNSQLFQSFPTKVVHFSPNFKIFVLGGGYIGQFSQILQLLKSFPTEAAQNDPQWPILPLKWLRLARNGQFRSIFNFSHLFQQRVAQIGSEWPISPDLHLFLSFSSKAAHSSPNFIIFVFRGGQGYIELWSCQICHKIFLPDFQLFIPGGGGGGWQGYIELLSCQICHKNFRQISNFSFWGGGGGGGGGIHLQVDR